MATIPTPDTARFLDLPWLTGAADSIRATIAQLLNVCAEPPGAKLLDQGRPNLRLWFVTDGSVAVERSHGAGRPEVLARLDGPAIYGTTTFFRGSTATMTLRATTTIRGWTLDRASYDRLRVDHPEAAEALNLAVVCVLSDRFDQLDRRLASLMADHDPAHPRMTEWANFRSRLFEEPAA